MARLGMPNLRVQLRPSRYPLWGVGTLYVVTLPMIWLNSLAWQGKFVLLLLLLASGAWYWRQLRKLLLPTEIRLLPDGSWALLIDGKEVEASLRNGVYRSLWLMRLPLQLTDGRRLQLMLWPDSAEPDQLRHLRSWLRWG
ncbi:protein YgfX [Chitinimonas sp. PSY-7]|uniref:protein YgfX n=1 Tax=Chitinimonas sp. PSY-7 TaxID=3459088 RepID=UPI00403FF249